MATPTPTPTPTRTSGEVVFELMALGIAMQRQNLRRLFPDETEAEVEERLRSWLESPASAPFGDAEGRPGRWPRTP